MFRRKPGCRKSELISAYIDGELSEKKARRLELHISSCPECRRLESNLRRIDTLILSQDGIEPSPGFDTRFWQKVRSDSSLMNPPEKRKKWFEILWRPAPLVLAAAGLALALMVYLPATHRESQTLPPASVALVENLELYENYDMIEILDLLEAMPYLEAAKGTGS